jgi:hypothetical protein
MASDQVKIACYSLSSLIYMDLLQVFRRSEGVVIALQNPLFALGKSKPAGAIASIGRQRAGFENLYLEKGRFLLRSSPAIRSRLSCQPRTELDGDFRPGLNHHPQLESSQRLCWDDRSFQHPR